MWLPVAMLCGIWMLGLIGCGDVLASSSEAETDANRVPTDTRLPEAPQRLRVDCEGVHLQGGASICRTRPGTHVILGEARTEADHEGVFVVGFDRDAPATETLRLEGPAGESVELELQVEPREYEISRINGLPPSQVSNYTAAQSARIAASSKRKRAGDRSRWPGQAFSSGFAWPLEGRESSSFGAQRILNGEEKRPHYGVDLAAPHGTPIASPADGLVTLADEDLYFEGAMIVLDHGQGFLSKYLHVSRIDVKPGQRVRQGQIIGAVGSKGRSTGPHLCWRLKWRDRNLDPSLWIAE
ncbi:MAG: M23 family metallopeptidase [Myxococcota bacterium]